MRAHYEPLVSPVDLHAAPTRMPFRAAAPRRGVVLVAGVERAYVDALVAAARPRGLEVSSSCEARRLRLRVLGLDGFGRECCDGGTEPVEMGLAAVRCEACARVRDLQGRTQNAPLVVLAKGLNVGHVARVMRLGVADVIALPAPPAQVAERSLGFLAQAADEEEDLAEIVGRSGVMRAVRRAVRSAARTDSTVLLTGETGTGKGIAARAIHRLSRRREGPFVHVDCTALPASVIESELFGHERGSFTGAIGRRAGRFELATKGTIFLDEIGDLEPSLQAKLLRVLQEREYERVGGNQTLPMTARVIAATNRDLAVAMQAGTFRPDLFYRLAVFHVQLPPLREHPGDLPELIQRGLQLLGRSLGEAAPHLGGCLQERLIDYEWPGNVRELMNVLERLYVQRMGAQIDAADLDGVPLDAASPVGAARPAVPSLPLGRRLPERERLDRRGVIAETLRSTGGNIARAARRLEVPRSTLRYWIKQHDLSHLIPVD